uniref:Lymphocyte antigen 6 complex locus protein G6c-like n=1 Tax=Geotrypetes seraphini TaxID=260995 RepID=A0A6P8N9H7_GEOSA|nr:lymphocyte antigen 6 complex locus protein G6c-like [Geotrypetes seraphini]
MKTFILLGLVTLCSLAVVKGLQCNVCVIKLPIIGCVKGKEIKTCSANEKCQTIKAYFGNAPLFSKLNCADQGPDNCNVSKQVDNTFGYNYEKTCCAVDLCNSASALQLSLLAGFSAMITLLLNLS